MADDLLAMKRKVDKGIEAAKEILKSHDDESLEAVVDEIKETFDYFMSMTIILAAGTYAFYTRTPEQVIQQLTQYREAIKNGGTKSLMYNVRGGIC